MNAAVRVGAQRRRGGTRRSHPRGTRAGGEGAEDGSAAMLERRTALEFLSSDALGGGIDAVHVRYERVTLPPTTR
jgi:hypothetical protein